MKKTIVFLIISILFSQLSILYVNYKEKDNIDPPLKDMIVDNLPDFSEFMYLYDMMSLPPFILTLLYIKKMPISNLIRNLSIIFTLRGICILTTSLPKFESCKIDYRDIKSMFTGGCYDKIFSGHIAFIITFILYLINYTEQKDYKIIYYFYAILASLLSFVTKSHYSIDVIISWIISFSIFILVNKQINY